MKLTYRELDKVTAGKHLPVAGNNDNDEVVIIESGAGSEGRFFRLTTAQSNGWCRINTYYEDGDAEEAYRK